MKDKFILDACCGLKEMWFDKKHPNTIYTDIREGKFDFNGKEITISPDLKGDFRKLPFEDRSFKLVVLDPPHLKNMAATSVFQVKWGKLHAETWQGNLKKALKECLRVLEDYGLLIFKWNDHDIKTKRILPLFPMEPLFAQKTHYSRDGKTTTAWYCFMKIPEGVKNE